MRGVLWCLAALALAGCGTAHKRGGYFEDDGPHDRPRVAAAEVDDAVPRAERLSASGNRPYVVYGKTYHPMRDERGYRERGVASWYGKKFHGRRTSSGETYDMYAMTAAHRTLPLPSYVRVRNLRNGLSVVVRVNDRGPFLHNRLIDLSYVAAAKLDIVASGTGLVEVEAVSAYDAPSPASQTAAADERAPADSKPLISLVPSAQAAQDRGGVDTPSGGGEPRLFVQVGAFREWDNAVAQRTRLERIGYRPIFIESVLLPEGAAEASQRIYRVRIGPLENVAAADRVTQSLAEAGVNEANLVVD